jgi:uncharacterized phiE125 gp8 family phage protein
MADHIRLDANEDYPGLTASVAAAVEHVESYTQRLLVERSATLRLPGWPPVGQAIALPGGKVREITSITADGEPVDSSTYEAFGRSPARLEIEDPPTVESKRLPVVITYMVGFPSIPPGLVAAIKLIAADMHENREAQIIGTIVAQNATAKRLMDPWRIRSGP